MAQHELQHNSCVPKPLCSDVTPNALCKLWAVSHQNKTITWQKISELVGVSQPKLSRIVQGKASVSLDICTRIGTWISIPYEETVVAFLRDSFDPVDSGYASSEGEVDAALQRAQQLLPSDDREVLFAVAKILGGAPLNCTQLSMTLALLGIVFTRSCQYHDSIIVLKACTRFGGLPSYWSGRVLNAMGAALLHLGDYGEAKTQFDRVLAMELNEDDKAESYLRGYATYFKADIELIRAPSEELVPFRLKRLALELQDASDNLSEHPALRLRCKALRTYSMFARHVALGSPDPKQIQTFLDELQAFAFGAAQAVRAAQDRRPPDAVRLRDALFAEATVHLYAARAQFLIYSHQSQSCACGEKWKHDIKQDLEVAEALASAKGLAGVLREVARTRALLEMVQETRVKLETTSV